MTDTPEQQHEAAAAVTSDPATKDATTTAPTSPARSDKSSDSEGKNVREKLKDTQIDAPPTSNPISGSDQTMSNATNGTAKAGDQSVSGSDSERGRLRRKRSREDFEDDADADRQPEKKIERHARKRSRDITKDLEAGMPAKPSGSVISSIKESDPDEHMTSPNKTSSTTTTTTTADKGSGSDTSPKNKRTREEAEKDTETTAQGTVPETANGKPAEKALGEERDSKRLRDKEGSQPTMDAAESKAKVCQLACCVLITANLTLIPDPTWKWVRQHFCGVAFRRHGSQIPGSKNLR
jgi:Ran-binding protein 3